MLWAAQEIVQRLTREADQSIKIGTPLGFLLAR